MTPIDYQPPGETLRERGSAFSTGGVIGGTVAGLIVTLMFVGFGEVVAKFAEIFRDFNLTLPWVTQVLVDVSSVLRSSFYLPLLSIPLICAFAFPLLARGRGVSSTESRILRVGLGTLILIVLVLLVLIFMIFALFMPMVSLMQGMSSGKA